MLVIDHVEIGKVMGWILIPPQKSVLRERLLRTARQSRVSSKGSIDTSEQFRSNSAQTGHKTGQGQLPEDEARQHYPQC